VGTGCESLQKKFIRKSKPQARPSPIISFQDYTRAITPLDRYRKHYVLFEYWNAELLDGLKVHTTNSKRLKRTSAESLEELRILRGLLQDDLAARMDRIIEERQGLDRQIQSGSYSQAQLDAMRRALETQTRQLDREFFWRDAEDRLRESTNGTPDASPD
jgi:hypothetical protein